MNTKASLSDKTEEKKTQTAIYTICFHASGSQQLLHNEKAAQSKETGFFRQIYSLTRVDRAQNVTDTHKSTF